jgi:sec-independent protein translocase protein TatC
MVGYEDRLTLMEHLDELRKRLFKAAILVVAGIIFAAIFNDRILHLLLRPLPLKYRHITTFSPAEPFMVSLKVWVYVGLVAASPFIIYQLWAFLAPAFSKNEKKYFYPIVVSCSLLFLGGVFFCYMIVLPKGLAWLLGFNGPFFNVQNRAQEYFSFVALFLLAFGAVFELPVVIVLATRVGVVDVKFLRKNRKYAILINAVIAAVATPSQDAFSMIAMFVPLIVLYEASLVVAHFVEPKRKQRLAAEAAVASSGASPPSG